MLENSTTNEHHFDQHLSTTDNHVICKIMGYMFHDNFHHEQKNGKSYLI